MSQRIYNFGAGPATLPLEILADVQAELLDWQGQGFSILEAGHRAEPFMALMDEAERLLRELLNVPANYHVLFLGCPARLQFSMIPLNLISNPNQGAYLLSGVWSSLALDEAKKVAHAYTLASNERTKFTDLPQFDAANILENTAYVYYTPNETIQGLQFPSVPSVGEHTLVADMTSCLLSEPVDVEDFGLIFAGAQKNIGPAGLTIVIVRDDVLKPVARTMPTMLDYQTHIKAHSLYATPPTFQCYFALKMFQWVKAQGGLLAMREVNDEKSARLYEYIDNSAFYHCAVMPRARSRMNVCFTLVDQAREADFLSKAEKHGLYALKGHRLVGGIRASLYNAMPMEGVVALIEYMDAFASGVL